MKNRDRYLLKVNEYDLLCRLQVAFGSGYCQCVIKALIGKDYPCKDDYVCGLDTCKECIQRWLNAETI